MDRRCQSDVRTPLALILGWGEQLEQDSSLPDAVRHKAAGIRTQCEKLRSLIDDLNLTVSDNGKGYPPEVLAALNLQETTENTPHILGLHVVEQIAAAHDGRSIFTVPKPVPKII